MNEKWKKQKRENDEEDDNGEDADVGDDKDALDESGDDDSDECAGFAPM